MNRDFVISRVRYHDGQETELANSDTVLHLNDKFWLSLPLKILKLLASSSVSRLICNGSNWIRN